MYQSQQEFCRVLHRGAATIFIKQYAIAKVAFTLLVAPVGSLNVVDHFVILDCDMQSRCHQMFYGMTHLSHHYACCLWINFAARRVLLCKVQLVPLTPWARRLKRHRRGALEFGWAWKNFQVNIKIDKEIKLDLFFRSVPQELKAWDICQFRFWGCLGWAIRRIPPGARWSFQQKVLTSNCM